MKYNEKRNILLILIACISIFILLILVILSISNNVLDTTENDNKNDDDFVEYVWEIEEKESEQLKNNEEYYKIIEIVDRYAQCFYEEDGVSRAKNLLDKSYLQNKEITSLSQLNKDYFYGYTSYNPYDIKYTTKNNISVFFVKGKFSISEEIQEDKEFNLVVKMDYKNYSFSIIPELCQNSDELYTEIIRNKNNTFIIDSVSNIEISQRHLSNYIYNINANIEDSFKLVNSEYRKSKFNDNFEKYKEYVENKYINKEYPTIEESIVYTTDIYNMYICKDSEGNNFVIKENDVNNFEIFLDSYTIIIPEVSSYYNYLSDKEKAIYNCENIIESIKTKNYEYSYNYLTNEEKEKKYNSIDQYNEFLNKFALESFKTLDDPILDKTDKGYVYVLNIENENTNEKKQIIIEINLKQEIDFEISIDIV